MFYRTFGKPLLDTLLSATVIAVSIPLWLLVAALVRIRLGTPVLFRQTRPGLYNKPFTLYKFRTMSDERDAYGQLLPDAERLTSIGYSLRSTSLDELPELLNVLKGDMSLVGPRPLLMQYLGRYSPEQLRRHEVKPGITGWAQVNGRNALSWERKFELDVWYVDHASLAMDIKILILTLWRVIKRENINPEGMVTMPEYQGAISKRSS